jgi:hypothetical protein
MRISVRHGVLGSVIALGMALGVDAAAAQDDAARDYTSCGHFETQAAAQEVLDAGLVDDPSVLDADGDGIACEFAFGGSEDGTTEGVRELPATGIGVAPAAGPGLVLFAALGALGLGGSGLLAHRPRHR